MSTLPERREADKEPAPVLTMEQPNTPYGGASEEAIQYHYDVGVGFYRLWIGDDLIYTAAKYHDPITGRKLRHSLAEAQEAKIEYHLDAIAARPGARVLDIGCGWGGFLRAALARRGAQKAVGLTLSQDQHDFIRGQNTPNLDIRLENYEDYEPDTLFDGIVTIGALEHFVRPELDPAQRHAVYRGYFERCHRWLDTDGRVSLQAITWGRVPRGKQLDYLPLDIFPETDPPMISEIVEASKDHFELLHMENSADDYVETLLAWRERLQRNQNAVVSLVGQDTYAFYDKYMRRSIAGFKRRRMLLCRFVFKKR
jgi:cyclopropane-fatty-acyl-phospholipid synthase